MEYQNVIISYWKGPTSLSFSNKIYHFVRLILDTIRFKISYTGFLLTKFLLPLLISMIESKRLFMYNNIFPSFISELKGNG